MQTLGLVVVLLSVGCRGSREPSTPLPGSSSGSGSSDRAVTIDVARVRADLERWEPYWRAARGCLVGEPQRAADVRDAVAIVALASDSSTNCGRAVAELSKVAVRELDGAVVRISQVIASDAPDETPYAIRDVDDAHDTLRAAAGLPAIARTGPEIAVATRITHPTIHRYAETETEVSVVDHVVRVRTRSTRVMAAGPDLIAVAKEHAPVPALDRSWAAHGDQGLRAGALDPSGGLVAGSPVVATPSAWIDSVLGSGNERAIVTAHDQLYTVHRMREGGRWTATKLPPSEIVSRGRDVVDFVTSKGAPRWLRETPKGETATPMQHGETGGGVKAFGKPERRPENLKACGAAVRWYVDGSRLRWLDAKPGALDLEADPTLVTCAGTAALIVASSKLRRCERGACAEGVAMPGDGFELALTSTGTMMARQQDRVVGIWQTGSAPAFVRLDEGGTLDALVVWNDVPYILVGEREAMYFVRAL